MRSFLKLLQAMRRGRRVEGCECVERERERETDRLGERNKERETETQRKRQRRTETETERDREREREEERERERCSCWFEVRIFASFTLLRDLKALDLDNSSDASLSSLRRKSFSRQSHRSHDLHVQNADPEGGRDRTSFPQRFVYQVCLDPDSRACWQVFCLATVERVQLTSSVPVVSAAWVSLHLVVATLFERCLQDRLHILVRDAYVLVVRIIRWRHGLVWVQRRVNLWPCWVALQVLQVPKI